MSVITQGGFVALQLARLYLEYAENSSTMTKEEAEEAWSKIGERVKEADEMWESAGG